MKTLQFVLLAVFIAITPKIYAAEFGDNSWNLDHYYMNLQVVNVGSSMLSTGYGTKSLIYGSNNILGTDVVDGVKCVRFNSIRNEKAEFSSGWVAQDTTGNIYLLKHWDGENANPIVYGKNKAVMLLPKNPKIGDIIFGDKTVVEVGVTVPMLSTGLGPFTNCLKTVETDGDIVYIAPGIGDVKKEYAKEIGGFELKEVIYGAGYTTIDDSLKITIPNLVYKGMKLNITVVMDSYQNFDDPNGFYWKLNNIANNN